MTVFLAPKDTIDLIVTAAVIGTRRENDDPERVRFLADRADEIGQQLWTANYASVNAARGSEIPVPIYAWQPVFDLIWQTDRDQADYSLTPEQTLQIERSRLFLSENSREYPEWETSEACKFLEQLGTAVEARLSGWPIAQGEDPGVLEFRGLSAVNPRWTRNAGFPETSRADR